MNNNNTSDKIDLLLFYMFHYVLLPLLFIGFIVSVILPGQRIGIGDVLSRGFFIFIVLLIAYGIIEHRKNKKK